MYFLPPAAVLHQTLNKLCGYDLMTITQYKSKGQTKGDDKKGVDRLPLLSFNEAHFEI